MPEDKISRSIVTTIKETDLSSFASELAEPILDNFIEDGLLRDIPVINTIVAIGKTGITISNLLFAKKLSKYLAAIPDVDQETREIMVERLENDPKYRHKVGEHILLLIDSTSSLEKAELMGRAFKAYCEEKIDSDMLQKLYYAVDRILISDLDYFPKLIEARKHSLLDFQPPPSFINAGLVYYPLDMGTTAIVENTELCSAFIDHLFIET